MILWLNEEKTRKLESEMRGHYRYWEFRMFGEKEPRMQWVDSGSYHDICTKTSTDFKDKLINLISNLPKTNFYRNKISVERGSFLETQYRVDNMCWCLSYDGALLRSLEKALIETESENAEYTEASLLIKFTELGNNLQSFVNDWDKKLENNKEEIVTEE